MPHAHSAHETAQRFIDFLASLVLLIILSSFWSLVDSSILLWK